MNMDTYTMNFPNIGQMSFAHMGSEAVDSELGAKNWRSCFRHEIEIAFGDKHTSFYFWGSINDFENGRNVLRGEELIFPAYCFFFDASAYLNAKDIDAFASELGYTKPSELLKAWKGCKKAWKDCKRLGLSKGDVFEIRNHLQDTGQC